MRKTEGKEAQNMDELQFLTEEDMKYFEDLQEKGEAVILKISDEELLSMDFSKPLDKPKADPPINQEELEQWVKEYKEEFHERYEKNRKITQENELMKKQVEGDEVEEGISLAQDNTEQTSPEQSPAASRENPATTLTERLQQVDLDPQRAEIIADAIARGWDDWTILMLLQDGLSFDEMKQLYNLLLTR